jgi:translation initiation factor 1
MQITKKIEWPYVFEGSTSQTDMDFNLDPFKNTSELDVQKSKIDIRFQQMGPRSITLIEGLDDDLDIKRISKAMKKQFNCAASIHKDKDEKEIIKLQGDHRQSVREWIISQGILTEAEADNRIVMHGN